MVKRIEMSMVDGLVAALEALEASEPDPDIEPEPDPQPELIEAGDLQWSARAIKAKWLKCEGQAVSRATYADLFSEIGVTFGAGDGSTTFNLPDGRGRALIGVGTGVLTEAILAASWVAATDLITVASNADKWLTGMIVRVTTSGTLPTPIVAATNYFVIRISATTIKLATSLTNAMAGTAINLTATGTGSHTITHTLTARAMGQVGGAEVHALTVAEMPSHTHPNTGVGNSFPGGYMVENSRELAATTGSTGGDTPHNNMPPFLGANLFIYVGV